MSEAPQHDPGPGVRFPPPLVYVLLAAVAWGLHERWPLRPPVSAEPILDPLGAAMMAAGLGLDALSLWMFWRQRTSPLPFRGAAAFVARGPYRFTRNPMYLGMTLLVAGAGLLFERLGLMVAALLGAAIIDRFVIRREEQYLQRRFGDSYREYTGRVRRWV